MIIDNLNSSALHIFSQIQKGISKESTFFYNHLLTFINAAPQRFLRHLGQTLDVELIPQRGPVLGEDLRTQLPALAAGRSLATMPLGRIHAHPFYPGHFHGRRHDIVALQKALPKMLLRQRRSAAAHLEAVHNFLFRGFGGQHLSTGLPTSAFVGFIATMYI